MNRLSGPADRDVWALYDDAPCGLLVTDGDGTIRLINLTFCRWLGRDKESLVGEKKLQDLLAIGGRIFYQTHLAPLLQMQGSVAEVKLDLVHRDGHAVPMLLNATRRNRGGSVEHEIAAFIAEDRQRYEREFVIARKRAEELLVKETQAQQALLAAQAELRERKESAEDRALFAEQMIGIVSHDLRSPLNVIMGNAALLRREPLSARQLRSIEGIDRAVARSARMLGDLLDFTQARIGNGLKVKLRPVDLHELVGQAVDELRVSFANRSLVHIAQGAAPSLADADRITQALANLVTNAVTYGDPRAPVTVTTRTDAGGFTLDVHNEGAPLPAAIIPTLFDAMTRGDAKGQDHSVGLGLFIVREIARAHGGDVTVRSEPGLGTRIGLTVSAPAP